MQPCLLSPRVASDVAGNTQHYISIIMISPTHVLSDARGKCVKGMLALTNLSICQPTVRLRLNDTTDAFICNFDKTGGKENRRWRKGEISGCGRTYLSLMKKI